MPNNINRRHTGIPFDTGKLWDTLKTLFSRWKILFFLVPLISLIIGFIPYIGHLILQYLGQAVSGTVLKQSIERIGKRHRSHKTLQHYLESVIEATQYLNPRGSSQTQTLMHVNVPLDDIFIHQRLVIDLPIYDRTGEQHQALLKELRQQSDLNAEERENLIHRLDITSNPQLEQELAKVQKKQQMTIEDVLQQMEAGNNVAVILGSPGSGKSTLVRWLALQMARSHIAPRSLMPESLPIRQIPILLSINDYAARLSSENLAFEQFFRDQVVGIHSDLPDELLTALRKGRCLVMLDGLDEVGSDTLRRRVAEAIRQFISNYATPGTATLQYNRFIITSRVIGYDVVSSYTIGRYAHYTLLDFEDKQIKQFLHNWYPAVERYKLMFTQGMKPLRLPQKLLANASGSQQSKRLFKTLKNSPGIKRLAVNPLMLTILARVQRSGQTLPHRRVELYQEITNSLLENKHLQSERPGFSREEVPLAEHLLLN